MEAFFPVVVPSSHTSLAGIKLTKTELIRFRIQDHRLISFIVCTASSNHHYHNDSEQPSILQILSS